VKVEGVKIEEEGGGAEREGGWQVERGMLTRGMGARCQRSCRSEEC